LDSNSSLLLEYGWYSLTFFYLDLGLMWNPCCSLFKINSCGVLPAGNYLHLTYFHSIMNLKRTPNLRCYGFSHEFHPVWNRIRQKIPSPMYFNPAKSRILNTPNITKQTSYFCSFSNKWSWGKYEIAIRSAKRPHLFIDKPSLPHNFIL